MTCGILNITNGDYFNEYFLKAFGGEALPFCEAMMDGATVTPIFSEQFVSLRSKELGISTTEYRSKMQVYDALRENHYAELHLWFGKDTLCQINLLTLLAYLEETQYCGEVLLNYIDDETFEVLEKDISVKLGSYQELYRAILMEKKMTKETGALILHAIDLYFDYHSENGFLTKLARENAEKDKTALVCLLLENSKDYGLSDTQAEKLIYRHFQRESEIQ